VLLPSAAGVAHPERGDQRSFSLPQAAPFGERRRRRLPGRPFQNCRYTMIWTRALAGAEGRLTSCNWSSPRTRAEQFRRTEGVYQESRIASARRLVRIRLCRAGRRIRHGSTIRYGRAEISDRYRRVGELRRLVEAGGSGRRVLIEPDVETDVRSLVREARSVGLLRGASALA